MKETATRGPVAAIVAFLAALTPAQIELDLRIAAAGLGCIVAILTIVDLVRRWNKP